MTGCRLQSFLADFIPVLKIAGKLLQYHALIAGGNIPGSASEASPSIFLSVHVHMEPSG